MDTERQPQARPQITVLNASGNPWDKTPYELNGKKNFTDGKGVIDLTGLVGKNITSLAINGRKAILPEPVMVTANTKLVFKNCNWRISSILQE